jgi:hypothetical protein
MPAKVVNAMVRYDEIRPKLVSGHLVTFDGGSLLSRAIKLFAPGGSHTALVLRLSDCPDTVFLFESLEHGPDITAMSTRISNYDGRVILGMPPITIEQQRQITELALRLKAKRIGYDYPSLFRNIWRRVQVNMDRGFCSELAQYILMATGVIEPSKVAQTPGELRVTVGYEHVLAPYCVVPTM